MPSFPAHELTPDPADPAAVLAFVLCPPSLFAPDGDPGELEAIRELLRPVKQEAVRRWQEIVRD